MSKSEGLTKRKNIKSQAEKILTTIPKKSSEEEIDKMTYGKAIKVGLFSLYTEFTFRDKSKLYCYETDNIKTWTLDKKDKNINPEKLTEMIDFGISMRTLLEDIRKLEDKSTKCFKEVRDEDKDVYQEFMLLGATQLSGVYHQAERIFYQMIQIILKERDKNGL